MLSRSFFVRIFALNILVSLNQLFLDEFEVVSLEVNELIVSSSFRDLSIFNHDNLISVNNSREPVCNKDDSLLPTLNKLFQSLLNLSFRLSIECRGSFIQQQNLRPPNKRSRNSNPLLLSSGEFDTSLADYRIETIWEVVFIVDEIVGVRSFASLNEIIFCVVCSLETVGYVLSDCSGEKDGFLRYYSDLLVVPFGLKIFYVNVIVANLSVSGVVKPLNHRDDRGLAAT